MRNKLLYVHYFKKYRKFLAQDHYLLNVPLNDHKYGNVPYLSWGYIVAPKSQHCLFSSLYGIEQRCQATRPSQVPNQLQPKLSLLVIRQRIRNLMSPTMLGLRKHMASLLPYRHQVRQWPVLSPPTQSFYWKPGPSEAS